MKPDQHSAFDTIGLSILKKGLFVGMLGVTGLVCYLLFELEEKYNLKVARVAAVFVFVIGLAMTFFTLPEVIERMRCDKTMLLSDSIAHSFYSYLMKASFLPIVGPLFARMIEKKKNPFTQNKE